MAGNEKLEGADEFLFFAGFGVDLDNLTPSILDFNEGSVGLENNAEGDVLQAVAGFGESVVGVFRQAVIKRV